MTLDVAGGKDAPNRPSTHLPATATAVPVGGPKGSARLASKTAPESPGPSHAHSKALSFFPTLPTCCTFEALICAHISCTSPARDVVKVYDCGCSKRKLRNPACVSHWVATSTARKKAASADADSPAKEDLRKSSAGLWAGFNCDSRVHFCGEHGRKSTLLEAMRKREGVPRTSKPWCGPFPGEYPPEPTATAKGAWTEVWNTVVRSWKAGEMAENAQDPSGVSVQSVA